ncbi:hypothetical protein XANCAGTX0491_008498 [Xanthoria calcicola]
MDSVDGLAVGPTLFYKDKGNDVADSVLEDNRELEDPSSNLGSDDDGAASEEDVLGDKDEGPSPGEGEVCIHGQSQLVHRWLDWEYSDRITAFHNVNPIGGVPGLETELHDYQRVGIAKMLHCWNGPNRAVLLGDMMGIGKTIDTIVACVLDKDRVRGAFDLIVTTKTCTNSGDKRSASIPTMSGHKPSVFTLDKDKH